MENTKVTRSWGVAVAIVAAVVCIAAAALTLTTVAKAQQTPQPGTAVVTHWLPQPVLEAKFRERILKDNQAIAEVLNALADPPRARPDQKILKDNKAIAELLDALADPQRSWTDEKNLPGGLFPNTYLANARLWTKTGWSGDWLEILKELKAIFAQGGQPVITSVTVLIEYQPNIGILDINNDIDAIAKIRMTFSASPDGHVLEGTLKHSRVCEVI
jgi:hypothetical protein